MPRRRKAGRRSFSTPTATASVDEYTEPSAAGGGGQGHADRTGSGPYAVMPHPTDGSIWYTVNVFAGPPGFMRFDPKTKLSEVLRHSEGRHRRPRRRHRQERRALGLGLERHLISFDRSKCKDPLNGPNATGNHCPEGFASTNIPAPASKASRTPAPRRATTPGSTTTTRSGLGENIPISTANLNDGFVALQGRARWSCCAFPIRSASSPRASTGASTIRTPAGKAAGLWSTSGDRTPWLMEGGKGSKPRAVHIQFRPDPLAH